MITLQVNLVLLLTTVWFAVASAASIDHFPVRESETDSPQVKKLNDEMLRGVNLFHEDLHRLLGSVTGPTTKLYANRTESESKSFFSKFQRYSSIQTYLDQLARKYPSLVTVESIGKSFEGRDLTIVRVSAKGKELERQKRGPDFSPPAKEIIFIDAGLHAREWLAPATALYIIHLITSGYEKDELTTRVLDTFDFVILPLANPDGYEYSHTHYRNWRKTRRIIPNTECVGVDPNRNFDFHWMGAYSSSDPCSDLYAGSRPFSEPETRALGGYLFAEGKNIRMYISLHTYGQKLLYPWTYKNIPNTEDKQLAIKAKVAVDAISKVYGTKFEAGPGAAVLYPAAETSLDWAYGVIEIPYCFTFELRKDLRAPEEFKVPASEIEPSGVEMTAGILAVAKDIIEDDEDNNLL